MESLKDIMERIREHQRQRQNNDDASASVPEADPSNSMTQCDICKGHRFLVSTGKRTSSQVDRLIPCGCVASELQEDRYRRLRLYSNLGSLGRCTFDTLNPDHPSLDDTSYFLEALQACYTYATNPTGWLVLAGLPGSGKTHLAAAIANAMIADGKVVLFMYVPDLLDAMRSGYSATNDIPFSLAYQQVTEVPILILDGLGTHNTTPWAQEKLQQVFNNRFNSELPTVVTTAVPINALDPHIGARLNDKNLSAIHTTTAQLTQQPQVQSLPPPNLLDRMTFETFNYHASHIGSQHRASLQEASRAAFGFASAPHGWLTLIGPTGVGKTHLAVAIAEHLLTHSAIRPHYTRVQPMLTALQAAFSPRTSQSFDTLLAHLANTPLLILDDLGDEVSSPWTLATLQELLTHRHDLALPTVVTTKVNMYDEHGPIASRLTDTSLAKVVHILSRDFRRGNDHR